MPRASKEEALLRLLHPDDSGAGFNWREGVLQRHRHARQRRRRRNAAEVPRLCLAFPAALLRCRSLYTTSSRLGQAVLGRSTGCRCFEKPNQVAHRAMAVQRMTKRKLVVNLVTVATSVARLCQIARLLEVTDNRRNRSFRDPDHGRDVSKSGGWIAGNAL